MYEWLWSWFPQTTETKLLQPIVHSIPNHGITEAQLQIVKLKPLKKQNRCGFSPLDLKETKRQLKPVQPIVFQQKQDPEAIYIRNHLKPTSQHLW